MKAFASSMIAACSVSTLHLVLAVSAMCICQLYHSQSTGCAANEYVYVLQEMLLSEETRRKLSVHVTGASAKSQQNSATDSAAETSYTAAGATATTASAEESAEKPGVAHKTADSAAANKDSTANKNVPVVVTDGRVQVIKDMWAFKRSQMLYPSVK